MKAEFVAMKNLPLKSERTEYPKGKNAPTVVARYGCPCGAGEVVERNALACDDRVVTLECAACQKEYQYFVDIADLEFVFYRKGDQHGKI